MRMSKDGAPGWLAPGMDHDAIVGDFPEPIEAGSRAALVEAAERDRWTYIVAG